VRENSRPACLLFGEKERRFHDHRYFAGAAMPNLEIVPLDAGHGVNMEQPAAFNEAVAGFIRRCATS
jgi:pimeloyl-ACP methyl ester carboxylesterase